MISKFLKGILFTRKNKSSRQLSPVFEKGFHGDEYLLSLVNDIMQVVDAFIETGTNVGTTARYVAKTYPHIPVYSCEPDSEASKVARRTLRGCENAHLYKIKSPDFLHVVHKEHPSLMTSTNLYFLDAHGFGYQWPLKEEIHLITNQLERGIIIIDDFQVPSMPQFRYDAYEGQECNLPYIQSAMAPQDYLLCYPHYTEHTSLHHPLVGYVMISFGNQNIENIISSSDSVFRVIRLAM